MLAALLVALTFVGIPLAFILWIVGCWPYRQVFIKRQMVKWEWENRDRPLDEEAEKPWEL